MRWLLIVSSIWSGFIALAELVRSLSTHIFDGLAHGLRGAFHRAKAHGPAEPKHQVAPTAISPRKSLVKSRPMSLEERYHPIDSSQDLDQMFLRMRDRLYEAADAVSMGHVMARPGTLVTGMRSQPRTVLRETGRLGPKRPYFYLKPINEIGWLFERSGAGWVVSRAEKIVGNDTFLRRGEPWDIVTLHESAASAGNASGTIRVTSRRIGGDLIPFSVYESKLGIELFDQMAPGSQETDFRSSNLNEYLTGD